MIASEIGFEEADQQTVDRLLREALDAGLNVIDTGECYRNSEEMIGRAVSNRRDHYYLFTKCGHPHGFGEHANWSKDSILESIERSLRRLKTDKIDIVQLHSCSETELRKGEAIDALRTARDRGYTRYIGYSGDSHAARFAVETGAFDTLQTSINIADQESIEIAVRIHPPRVAFDASDAASIAASIGSTESIQQAAALHHVKRVVKALTSICINIAILIAGAGSLLLSISQRRSAEYLWLGIYLVLVGGTATTRIIATAATVLEIQDSGVRRVVIRCRYLHTRVSAELNRRVRIV